MDRKRLLIKNSSIYALGDIMPRVFGLVIFPILTTYLPPEEYGIINYVNSIDTFMSVICVLGLNTFFLAFYYKEKDEEGRKELFSSLSYSIAIFSLVVSVLLHIFGTSIFKAWGSNVDFYPYISLGVIMNFFNIITFLPTCLYRVQENPLPLTIINVVKSLFILVVSVLAVTVIHGDAEEVLMGRCLVSFVFSFIFVYATRKYYVFRFNKQKVIEGLKFSLPLVPGSLSYYIFSLSDRILIDKYLTLRDLGLYTTATTLAMIMNFIYHGAYRSFEPYFFQNYGKTGFEDRFVKVRDTLLLGVLASSLLISIFSKEIIDIFASEKYATAYIYVPVITIGLVASAMSLVYGTIIIAEKKTTKSTVNTVIGCVISVTLNVLLLKHYGAMVAAVSFSLSYVVVMILNAKATSIKVSFSRALLASIIILTITLVVSYSISFSFLLNVLLKSIISIIMLFALVRLMDFDVDMIKSLVFKKKK